MRPFPPDSVFGPPKLLALRVAFTAALCHGEDSFLGWASQAFSLERVSQPVQLQNQYRTPRLAIRVFFALPLRLAIVSLPQVNAGAGPYCAIISSALSNKL